MTPARKRALHWFYVLGQADPCDLMDFGAPSRVMRKRMEAEGQIEAFFGRTQVCLRLTDKGRRDLHEAGG